MVALWFEDFSGHYELSRLSNPSVKHGGCSMEQAYPELRCVQKIALHGVAFYSIQQLFLFGYPDGLRAFWTIFWDLKLLVRS
jgi:hypothetical protein